MGLGFLGGASRLTDSSESVSVGRAGFSSDWFDVVDAWEGLGMYGWYGIGKREVFDFYVGISFVRSTQMLSWTWY